MSTHSNHLSRPMLGREQEVLKEPPVPILPAELLELLTRYLKGRQLALYHQLLQDDPQTTVSLGSQDNPRETLARLKEVEKLKTELQIIEKGTRNARRTRKPYA